MARAAPSCNMANVHFNLLSSAKFFATYMISSCLFHSLKSPRPLNFGGFRCVSDRCVPTGISTATLLLRPSTRMVSHAGFARSCYYPAIAILCQILHSLVRIRSHHVHVSGQCAMFCISVITKSTLSSIVIFQICSTRFTKCNRSPSSVGRAGGGLVADLAGGSGWRIWGSLGPTDDLLLCMVWLLLGRICLA